ncbi:MAG: hypothetical protein OXI63_01205 [Candidatus Poribacteria bacterium]|nr:hypothetical protein [Candidatus Poribacteria bacterium]
MGHPIKFILIICLLFVACNADKKEANPPTQPINIIVILDVSDRLLKEKLPGQERQTVKDKKIAKGIISQYENFARKTYYIGNRHRLAFVVPAQPGVTKLIPQETLETLKLWPTNEDRAKGAPRFREMKEKVNTAIDSLYQFIEDRQEFTGSDIWGWFKVSAEEYLQPNALNYIICISDGYLYLNRMYLPELPREGNKTAVILHDVVERFSREPNWKTEFVQEGYGLLSIDKDFSESNVKFLMVEVGLPTLRVKDLPILKAYWIPWLQEMGISEADFIHTQDDPQVVIEKIKDFLSPPKRLVNGK